MMSNCTHLARSVSHKVQKEKGEFGKEKRWNFRLWTENNFDSKEARAEPLTCETYQSHVYILFFIRKFFLMKIKREGGGQK